jgi:hypothetical protein
MAEIFLLYVATPIRGDIIIRAHGTKEMPVWGPIFLEMGGGNSEQYHLRITT